MGCCNSRSSIRDDISYQTSLASLLPRKPSEFPMVNEKDHFSVQEIKITPCTIAESEKQVKIITLGSGESGKSTLFRQLKRIFLGGFSKIEITRFKRIIQQSIIEDIKNLIDLMENKGQNPSTENKDIIETIQDLDPNADDLDSINASYIAQIWRDPVFQEVFKNANSIGLGENAAYFFDNVERIAAKEYKPSDEDILKVRIRTTGIDQVQFQIKDLKTVLVDVGGQKTERKQWQKCYQNVSYILFVVSLSDFDQIMFEDGKTRRTDDSIQLFSQILNNEYFQTIPLFLVLNKYDVFEKKFLAFPDTFKAAYPSYDKSFSDPLQAVEHVKQIYLQHINAGRSDTAWVKVEHTTIMNDRSVQQIFQTLAKQIIEDESQK